MGVNETLVDWWRKNISPIPYNTWKWIGKNFTLYTTPYFETYDHREKLKQQLQSEYERMEKKYGKDFEKRVYSGETIVGGKKKMFWTKDGWKEGEKKQNIKPFRVKKVGEKFEYDFMSYDEWEKMMSNLEDENGLDEK